MMRLRKPLGSTVLVAAGMLASTSAVTAADLVIVKSGDSAGQSQAIAALRGAAGAADVQEVDVKGTGAFEPAVLQKLRASPPKVLAVLGNTAAKAAKDSKIATAIVFGFVVAHDKMGLSGAGHGGVSSAVPVKAQLQALAGLSPAVKRVGVVHDASSAATVEAAQAAASELGLTLVAKPVSGPTALPPAVRALMPEVDGLLVIPDPSVAAAESLKFVLKTALESSKPTLTWSDQHFALGALMALTPGPEETGRLMGEMSAQALKGDAAFATVKEPAQLRLSVNVRAAENIGIAVDATGAERDGNFASRVGSAEAPPLLGVKGATQVASATPAPAAEASGVPDTEPQVLESARAEYPPMALKQKKEGQVVVDVHVGVDGNVLEAKVVKGSSMFNDAALSTIRKYKFAPARRGGRPAEGHVQITINFKL
jgi:putative ABC transport system substrate-binding protein